MQLREHVWIPSLMLVLMIRVFVADASGQGGTGCMQLRAGPGGAEPSHDHSAVPGDDRQRLASGSWGEAARQRITAAALGGEMSTLAILCKVMDKLESQRKSQNVDQSHNPARK